MNFVYADEARQLLHLIYVGTLDRDEAMRLFDSVKETSKCFCKGFNVLADLRDLKEVDKDAVGIIDELMEFLNDHGAGKIVRVLPNETENFGFSLMSIFHYGNNVRFVTCLNLEQAFSVLSDKSENTNKVD